MTATATPIATGHTMDDAAEAMAGLVDDLFDLDDSDAKEEERANHGVDSKESDSDEDDTTTVETKSEDEAEAEPEDEPESEESEQDDEAADTTETGEKMVTVQVGSKSVELPESVAQEVTAGIQRMADYTQKTQALAAEKKQFESEIAAVRQERAELKAERERVQATLNLLAMPEPSLELAQIDSQEYFKQLSVWKNVTAVLQANDARLQELTTKEQTQQQTQWLKDRASAAATGAQKLIALIPAWSDPKVLERERDDLVKYAKSIGYTDQELRDGNDHRAFYSVYRAMKLAEVESKTKEIKPTPRGKTIAASSPARNSGKSGKRNSAQDRLARTGSLDDFAAAVSDMEF